MMRIRAAGPRFTSGCKLTRMALGLLVLAVTLSMGLACSKHCDWYARDWYEWWYGDREIAELDRPVHQGMKYYDEKIRVQDVVRRKVQDYIYYDILLRNTTPKKLRVNYLVDYFWSSGLKYGQPFSNYEPLVFEPYEVIRLHGRTPEKGLAYFALSFMKPQLD